MTSPNVSSSAGTNAVIENVVACAASNTVASKRRKRAVGGDYEYAITAIGGSATGGGSESESTATGSESESTATGSESESTAAEGGSESESTATGGVCECDTTTTEEESEYATGEENDYVDNAAGG